MQAKDKSSNKSSPEKRHFPWLKTPLPGDGKFFDLRAQIKRHKVNTVCESATCPNIGVCWGGGTMALMILGDRCSRACRFCDVPTGDLLPPDPKEPDNIAKIISLLSLKYVVVTSVDRDDLPDGGAGHWVATIRQIKNKSPSLKLEVLIPDFKGNTSLIGKVCESKPDVIAHNIETVRSLQSKIRPQCRYEWSLDTLSHAHSKYGLTVKSGMMLGLGENKEEVIQAMEDLVKTGCSILSLGQYLQPSTKHIEVVEYIKPEVFSEYKEIGESLGLKHVEAGPLVRSSFQADKQAGAAGVL
jgi:lipoic acid synthetase